jgi:hypothetical protein
VVDYLSGTLSDGRVVAHLLADEPPENARIISELYLADDSKGRCRAITPEDFEATRHGATEPVADASAPAKPPHDAQALQDAEGNVYEIRVVATDRAARELHWTRSRADDPEDEFEIVTLRDVVARLEAYEPARTRTSDAIALHGPDRDLGTYGLQAELDRLQESPIVLNRRLREAVLHTLRAEELSMSEIAMRCGRIKRDRRGNETGETSWLARRLGLLPEGGRSTPTPWIHSDVLALIARGGVGVSPREVEI